MNIMARAMTFLVLLCLGLPQTMPTNTPETPAKEEDILQKQDDLVAVKNHPGLETTFETLSAEGMSVSRVRGSAPLPLYPHYLDELPSIPSP